MSDSFKKAPNGKNISVFSAEFIRAAEDLGLEYKFITPDHEDIEKYIEITDGNKTFRVIKAMTPLNDAVAPILAKKKPAANKLLKEAGLPVPNQIVINSIDDPAINELNYPVVVKPLDLSGGKGITANVKDKSDLEIAINEAKKIVAEKEGTDQESVNIIIEEMIKGFDHRILVLGDKVIAAIRKHTPKIIADGKNTIEELIKQENQTQKRASKELSDIKIDNDLINTIKDQGYELDSVPKANTEINLHMVSNLSRGATTENITDTIHQDFKDIAVKAAKTIGLQVAGVDIMASDITQAAEGQNAAIIEVNAHPGSRLHLYPNIGEAVDVNKIILKYYFNLK